VTVYLVGAGPGDPGLITVRGAELLARADVIVHDRLVHASVLELAPHSAMRVDVGKQPGSPRSQHEISDLLIDLDRTHQTVVRLKGGDPFLFGRGGEEVEALLEAGVDVVVVPGITSAFAAPAYAGVPVTHRGLSTSVTIVTGHVGDPSAPGGVDWAALARADGTIVILMGMATRAEIARRLIDGGRKESTPVAVVQWGTTERQRQVRTTLGELSSVELDSPATIVVGAVAGLDLQWFEPPRLGGRTIVVTRPASGSSTVSAGLRRLGASVVSLPTISIAPPSDGGKALREAVSEVGEYDWVAFTSQNAVSGFLAALTDSRALAGVKLAVVGAATARALSQALLVADLVAEKSSAAGLADSIGPATGKGRVLFCRAEGALPKLGAGLRERGWSVDEVETYRTVAPGAEDGVTDDALERAQRAYALERTLRADAVVFASPSAVRGFTALVERALLKAVIAVCIGETTASEARTEGFESVFVATEASDDGLVAATVDALAGPGPPRSGVGSRK
jgi:uroporphyrinogen III methyltransferase/synthase